MILIKESREILIKKREFSFQSEPEKFGIYLANPKKSDAK
jgi:hypothetical protein